MLKDVHWKKARRCGKAICIPGCRNINRGNSPTAYTCAVTQLYPASYLWLSLAVNVKFSCAAL